MAIGTRYTNNSEFICLKFDCQVALMFYKSTDHLCRMANSEEYNSVYDKKVTGLDDTHTYLTEQIL